MIPLEIRYTIIAVLVIIASLGLIAQMFTGEVAE